MTTPTIDTEVVGTEVPASDASALTETPAEAVPAPDAAAAIPDAAVPPSDATPPASAVPATPAAPITAQPPLVISAAGRAYPIEGSYTDPNGNAVIPKALWGRMQELAGRGIHHEQAWPQFDRQLKEAQRAAEDAKTSVSAQEVQFTKLMENLSPILEEVIQRLPEAGPAIQRAVYEAQLAAKSHELTQFHERSKPTPDQVAAQTREAQVAGMQDILAAAAQHPDFAAMFADPAFSQRIHGKMGRRASLMVTMDKGRVTPDSVAAINAELLDMLDDFKERAPKAAVTASAAASLAAAKKPAPTPAKSVATNTPKDPKTGRFTNAFPDMPTNFEERKAWIENRILKGLPITQT